MLASRVALWAVTLGIVSHLPSGRSVPGSSGEHTSPLLQSTSVPDLLSDYVEWIRGGRTGTALVALDLAAAHRELARRTPYALFRVASPSSTVSEETGRKLATTFALELAAAGSRRQSAAAARIVEWACAYVRGRAPHDEFDRAWQLAALSVLEGGINPAVLREHLKHVRLVFPDEPRFLLAQAIAEEQVGAPVELLGEPPSSSTSAHIPDAAARRRAAEQAMSLFREASATDAVRAEAQIRLSHIQIEMNRYDDALQTLATVIDTKGDRALAFLGHLFRGLAWERKGHSKDAMAAYLSAQQTSPGAQSATLRMAALDFREGRRDQATERVDALLSNNEAHRDPWWSYYAGDWRLWPVRIERLRELVAGEK
jgi:tetratricopeptide (TPR) repeat protein